ncbi:hypothetical protein CYMTET_9693 [Cymbomonas tetramitiformis]|uniref:Uncharacterized protein n=1 Tax=Cymbomonas tetramitiformis TaxID=36881 RepID=A0AAE0GQP8_9CHLO|nr:hypothetical protein CYMTET_9693 [Cymbomonas tetramitiformis]
MVVLDACALFDNEGRRVEGRYFNPDHPINRQLRPPSGARPTPEQYASYDNWHTWNFNNENTGWSDEEGLSDAAWEDVLYCFSVDGDYDLCLRPDLGEEDLLSAHRIFDEFRQASQAKSEALRK